MNFRVAARSKRQPDSLETSRAARLETKIRAMRVHALSAQQLLSFTKIYALQEG
jgi:hypothetical protein